MTRLLLAGAASAVALAFSAALPAGAEAATCGLPDTKPLWVDFAHGAVQFRNEIFRRPGVIAATSGPAVSSALRSGGAQTVYWEMDLPDIVGKPDAPADPTTIVPAGEALFARAAAHSGCATPWIALNELWGPTVPTPWSAPTAQYRANVLTLLRDLSWRGARPFLLVPSNPNLAGDAALWWRDAAQYADVVREVYVKAPEIYAQGALLGSRTIRLKLRTAVDLLAGAGVQPERVGLMLGFQSGGIYGRVGLQPREAWFELVKWQTLAARQVAADHGVGTVWSWGWGTFGPASVDSDKPAAACVYLWTRDPGLCDAPTYAGAFNTSLTDAQILLPPGIQCSFGPLLLRAAAVDDATRVVGDHAAAATAVFARVVQRTRLRVGGADIRRAERNLIARRFGGRRVRYLRTLTARGLTLPRARDVLADELRRRTLGPELAAWTVAEQERLLQQAVCLRDELPATGDVRLADRVRFLRLA